MITRIKKMITFELLFALLIYQFGFTIALREIIGIENLTQIFAIAIVVIAVLMGLFRGLKLIPVIVLLGIELVLIGNYQFHFSADKIILQRFISFNIMCAPIFLVGFKIKDFVRLERSLYNMGIINLLLLGWAPFTEVLAKIGYMSYSYNMLPSILISILMYIKYKEKHSLQLAFLGSLLVFIFGARGAFLSVTFFIAACLFFSSKISSIKKGLSITAIIIIVYLISTNLEGNILLLKNGLNNIGISSYSVDKYLMATKNGITDSSSGRDNIYAESVKLVKDSFYFGSGIGVFESKTGIVYAHNIVLQLMNEFGFFITVILILIYSILIFKAVWSTHQVELFILMISLVFPKLLLTSTYWQETGLFAGISLALLSIIMPDVKEQTKMVSSSSS